jgi:hypothetical protein
MSPANDRMAVSRDRAVVVKKRFLPAARASASSLRWVSS